MLPPPVDQPAGSHGIRDQGDLEFAIYRPQKAYYHNVIDEAAARTESLVNSHALFDGNEGIRFAAADRLHNHQRSRVSI
jgi:prophage maintenance system killer protein